jgi:hypothetical protein
MTQTVKPLPLASIIHALLADGFGVFPPGFYEVNTAALEKESGHTVLCFVVDPSATALAVITFDGTLAHLVPCVSEFSPDFVCFSAIRRTLENVSRTHEASFVVATQN